MDCLGMRLIILGFLQGIPLLLLLLPHLAVLPVTQLPTTLPTTVMVTIQPCHQIIQRMPTWAFDNAVVSAGRTTHYHPTIPPLRNNARTAPKQLSYATRQGGITRICWTGSTTYPTITIMPTTLPSVGILPPPWPTTAAAAATLFHLVPIRIHLTLPADDDTTASTSKINGPMEVTHRIITPIALLTRQTLPLRPSFNPRRHFDWHYDHATSLITQWL
mmetsp:Transcript_5705/g.11060  ORF Transcript_5705/g.11060 Transcript_5705/m.11060 type:complete len:218 (+) Transcript_5705:893-1546(+)